MAGWKFLPRCGPTWAHSRRSIPRVDLTPCKMRADRRGDGAVERAGLENRNTRKRIVGSNPTLSAKTRYRHHRFARVGPGVTGTSTGRVYRSLPKKRRRASVGGCCQRWAFAARYWLWRSERCDTNRRNFRKALNVIDKCECIYDKRVARRRPP